MIGPEGMYLPESIGVGYGPGGSSGGGAPPAFAPTDIADIILWYDASDTSSLTQIAGSVSQMNDKSGSGFHATQGTALNQPITGTRTINGLNCLDCDGVNARMEVPSGMYGIANGPNTLFAVFAKDVAGDTNDAAISGNSANWGVRITATQVSYRNFAAVNKNVTPDTSAHICIGIRSGTSQSVYYDGGVPGTNASAIDGTLTNLRSPASDGPLDGRWGEVITYARDLTDAEINQVGNYLAAKWGITWTDI